MTARNAINVAHELAALQRMTARQLREKYLQVYGQPSHSGNKPFLIRRIIWRMQLLAEGDFEDRLARIQARAFELANPLDLRLSPPRSVSKGSRIEHAGQVLQSAAAEEPNIDRRLPPVGSLITRYYKGRMLQVAVQADGFEFEGQRFKSLSAVAKHVTGSHQNGFHFFRLGRSRPTAHGAIDDRASA